MANGDLARDYIVGEVERQIEKMEKEPAGDVCRAHSDLVKSQVLTMTMLLPMYKKQVDQPKKNESNIPEIATKWFKIRGQGAMMPGVLIALIAVIGWMVFKVYQIQGYISP